MQRLFFFALRVRFFFALHWYKVKILTQKRDSRTILCHTSRAGSVLGNCTPMSIDHKPDRPSERKRITGTQNTYVVVLSGTLVAEGRMHW